MSLGFLYKRRQFAKLSTVWQDGSVFSLCSTAFWDGSTWYLRKRRTWHAPDGRQHIHTSKCDSLSCADVCDGLTVDFQLAGMLMETMGWEHEGQETGNWDMSVLGFDEAWQEETNANAKQEESQQPKKVEKGKGRAVDQDA